MRLFVCFMAIGLLSCNSYHINSLTRSKISQCKATCTHRFYSCKKSCVDSCVNCSLSAHATASNHYSQYRHEERLTGGIIARELNSYRDPLQCRKTTCDCIVDLETCNQNCTGIIQKRLKVVHSCTSM